ncbi:hypothetical protein [Brevundimonas variabilis]|uniref:Uncharacterized protein n=1 Tax=Brevundimonas variabilis TaxID=74312 RepID=A0A7W9CGD7_9CAUL|nr:hypothetical protein [Brevundimonas variabilis]MBB5744948.1 hypothetical protein [Brevundimonas variabilis]
MNAIRPDLPLLPGVRPQPGAAPDVRAAFFRAALDQVQAVAPQPLPVPARAAEPTNRASAAASLETPTRDMRPGSLLDILI